jgi:hypothetical protein
MSADERQLIEGVRQEWEQLEDETGTAFDAFKVFRDLGVARTISEAYRLKTGRKQAKRASGQWLAWAKRFRWIPRAAAFDRHVAAIEAREEEKAFGERRRLWVNRRTDIQDSAWSLAAELEKKAREILSLPVKETVETKTFSEDGKTVTVTITHKPLAGTFSEGIRAAEMSDKLKRLAASMATERIIVKSPAAELAETLEDARAAFREARSLYAETESVETTARNIATAYALDAAQILEGYDEAAPLASAFSEQ